MRHAHSWLAVALRLALAARRRAAPDRGSLHQPPRRHVPGPGRGAGATRRRWSSRSRAGRSSSPATPTSRSSRPRTRSSRVTYAALVELGASYRFPTEVLGEGQARRQHLGGPARPQGLRRPERSPRASSAGSSNILWREGIRRVTGGIVGDESAFDSKRTAPGWLAVVRRHRVAAALGARSSTAAPATAASSPNPALAAAARFDRLLHARGIIARSAVDGQGRPRRRHARDDLLRPALADPRSSWITGATTSPPRWC